MIHAFTAAYFLKVSVTGFLCLCWTEVKKCDELASVQISDMFKKNNNKKIDHRVLFTLGYKSAQVSLTWVVSLMVLLMSPDQETPHVQPLLHHLCCCVVELSVSLSQFLFPEQTPPAVLKHQFPLSPSKDPLNPSTSSSWEMSALSEVSKALGRCECIGL